MNQYKRGEKISLSKNFSSNEFDCHGKNCCSTTKIDSKLIEYLQKIREHFNKPIIISSGYRCEKHNKKIGGATKSYHMKGQAADIVVKGIAAKEVAKYAESIGILGIGLYETTKDGHFTHIDTRSTKSFWYGQNEQPRNTFGGIPQDSITAPNKQDEEQGKDYHKSSSKYTIKLTFLQKGDKGRDVLILQELLRVHGYVIESSGKFDVATYNAVIDFQNKAKIQADGIVGEQTMKRLLTT